MFQCSSASRKFLNRFGTAGWTRCSIVSVLFSEPKIPQCIEIALIDLVPMQFQCSSASRKFLNHCRNLARSGQYCGFSALQRAENSSIRRCRSRNRADGAGSFSALQRAENSSIFSTWGVGYGVSTFQCSSASRKFLNLCGRQQPGALRRLFQCSSASRKFLNLSPSARNLKTSI